MCKGGVIRSQVLAGFQFRRGDLLRQPPQTELARDRVYAGYVIPDLQVAETRAEKANGRAAEDGLVALRAEVARLCQQRS